MKKKTKRTKIARKYTKIEPSSVALFREAWKQKGYELINITKLCEVKLGYSGWCNDINEPEEECHHIQIRYREEPIANVHANGIQVIDDDLYVVFEYVDPCGNDFIIFRKVKI